MTAEPVRLGEAGCFGDDWVELLFGVVVVNQRPAPEHEQSTYVVA